MKTIKLLVLAVSAILTISCSKKSNNDTGSTPGAGGNGNNSNIILQMQYFKGGFFAPPSSPNWSYDLTIDFTQFNAGYLVTAEHPDSLCFFGDGKLTEAETTIFLNLVRNLQLYVSSGPILADAGVEYIEFTMQDNSKRRYHLLNAEVPAGQYYANNPGDVRAFLQDLHASLPEACQ